MPSKIVEKKKINKMGSKALLCNKWICELKTHAIMKYGKCPKVLNSKWSDRTAYANSVDPDQEQSNQSLLGLPFH